MMASLEAELEAEEVEAVFEASEMNLQEVAWGWTPLFLV